MKLYLRMLRWVRPYWPRVALALAAMLVFALTSALPFPLIKPMLDDIFVHKDTRSLMHIPLLLVGVLLIKGAANFLVNYLMRHVGQSVVADLRRQLFRKIVRLPMRFFQRASSGDLISRVLSDAGQVESALSRQIVDIFKEALSALFLVAALFWLSWPCALIALVGFPLLLWPLARLRLRIRRASRHGQQQMGSLSSLLHETLAGILAVKSFQMEALQSRGFDEANAGYFRARLEAARLEAFSTPMNELCAAVLIGAAVYLGGLGVLEGLSTPGTFFALVAALFALHRPIDSLSRAGLHVQQALSAAARVFEVLDAPDEQQGGPLEVPAGSLEVRFRNVAFCYEAQPVLRAVDLELRPGEVVALVGASGAGKTTLAHLLLRLHEPTEGHIEINGIALDRFRLGSLRRAVGLVSQETILFRGSVRANLAAGGGDGSDRSLWQALQAAAAADFVAELPEGLDTNLGDRGSNLSGGQRQRLSLARALLKAPPILVLDEATSALDLESEQLVQAALQRQCQDRTILVIAHRLSTIQSADRIVVLEQGRIVESGTHAGLLERAGAYARLYEAAHQRLLSAEVKPFSP